MSREGYLGCRRHYAEMKSVREKINAALLPCGARVSYVGMLLGKLSVIWYFGKNETGFAGGKTPEAVVDDIYGKVFGGL